MKQEFDLHMHTSYSDGELPLEIVLKKIKENELKIFSITDHDSVDSIREIKKYDLGAAKYIKGIEVSSILDGKYKLHILGYNIDENNAKLNDVILKLKEARKKRFSELASYVEENFGFKIKHEDIEEVVENVNIPGKPHLAEIMIKYGYVSSVKEAFGKYLEDAKTKTSNRMDAKIVIEAIKDAGGIVIWAHPKKVEKKYNINFEELMSRLLELGLDGIEPFNSLHTYEESMRYLKYAKEHNLITSGGSDYHGENVKPDVKIGVIFNSGENIKIDTKDITLISKLEG